MPPPRVRAGQGTGSEDVSSDDENQLQPARAPVVSDDEMIRKLREDERVESTLHGMSARGVAPEIVSDPQNDATNDEALRRAVHSMWQFEDIARARLPVLSGHVISALCPLSLVSAEHHAPLSVVVRWLETVQAREPDTHADAISEARGGAYKSVAFEEPDALGRVRCLYCFERYFAYCLLTPLGTLRAFSCYALF